MNDHNNTALYGTWTLYIHVMEMIQYYIEIIQPNRPDCRRGGVSLFWNLELHFEKVPIHKTYYLIFLQIFIDTLILCPLPYNKDFEGR